MLNETLNSVKDIQLFKTGEDIARFRKDLEDGTEEQFRELDTQKRKTWAKAREKILCS